MKAGNDSGRCVGKPVAVNELDEKRSCRANLKQKSPEEQDRQDNGDGDDDYFYETHELILKLTLAASIRNQQGLYFIGASREVSTLRAETACRAPDFCLCSKTLDARQAGKVPCFEWRRAIERSNHH